MIDILFFTRGRGRGHAARDLAIAHQLRVINPALIVEFASYDIGYETLFEAGEAVHDLQLQERNPFPVTVVKATTIMRSLKPKLVVAQEEPAALIAAATCNIKALFTTSWFTRSSNEKFNALEYAHRILFMEVPGLFPVPETLQERIHYCGPVLRAIKPNYAEAVKLRARLGLSPEHTLITVLPGSPPEAREPIFDVVAAAFSLMKASPRQLLWIAGRDFQDLSRKSQSYNNILVLDKTTEVDSLIVASQLLITKGTYNIGREIMALGRRSISLSHRYNWVDDLFAAQWPTNTPLYVESTTSYGLALRLDYLLEETRKLQVHPELLVGAGARCAAELIIAEL